MSVLFLILSCLVSAFALAEGNCGSRPNTRIVGGHEAPVNSWPWQVQLRSSSGFPFCGGSLVDPSWVVTATHCVTRASPSSIYIRLGAHNRLGTGHDYGTEQDIAVAEIIKHENYHSPMPYGHDIALIRLAKPAKLGKGVGLVCLPDSSLPLPIDDLNKKCWITGWGRLASGGASPDKLMQVDVPLMSKERCLKGYPGKIHDSMLCAGLDQGGIDACQGDSGGPLVCEYNGKWAKWAELYHPSHHFHQRHQNLPLQIAKTVMHLPVSVQLLPDIQITANITTSGPRSIVLSLAAGVNFGRQFKCGKEVI
ncbi:hypothetical protein ACROYT_G008083 [Oculina patagonica]